MNDFITNVKRDFIFTGLASIVAGSLLIIYPGITALMVSYFFVIALGVFGLFHIMSYFFFKEAEHIFRFYLAKGIFAFAAAALAFVYPDILFSMFPLVLAGVVFVEGVMKLQNALDLRRFHNKMWWVCLLGALGCITIAALIVFYPFATTALIQMMVGAGLIFNGVTDIINYFALNHLVKKLRKAAEEEAKQAGQQAQAAQAVEIITVDAVPVAIPKPDTADNEAAEVQTEEKEEPQSPEDAPIAL